MKILQLCPKPLNQPMDGGKIAMLDMAAGLRKQGCEVIQLMIETPKHHFDRRTEDGNSRNIHRVFIDTRLKWYHALRNLIIGRSYNLSRFRNESYYQAIDKILLQEKFDVIQGESIFTLTDINRIRKYSDAPIILRSHNVEYVIWERMAFVAKSFFKKQYLKILSRQLRKEEFEICRQVDGIVVMSDVDRNILVSNGIKGPFSVIGIGSEMEPPERFIDQISGRQIFHLGSMNWMPNLEGIEWFIQEVWPFVLDKLPDLNLVLAGKDIHDVSSRLNRPNIIFRDAPDAREFMLHAGIMIVPLKSGSGIRVKIIEGLKLGKVIITTKVGVEGIPAREGIEILIAETAEEFRDKIVECFSNPELVRKISENAVKFASKYFDTALLAQDLKDFYQKIPQY